MSAEDKMDATQDPTDSDVEGHRFLVRAADDAEEADDVEGHRLAGPGFDPDFAARPLSRMGDEDDTEGHVKTV